MRHPDVLVVGAGIFGLWCARACAARGLRVVLAERARPGAGASGGPVGALTPHAPTGWTALKAYQASALLALEAEIAALEAETGRATGYARVGRLTPVASAKAAAGVAEQTRGAAAHWGGARLALLEKPPAGAAVLAPDACPHGLIHDTLSARVDPLAYLAALTAALAGVERRDGWTLQRLERGRAVFDRGEIAAGVTVLAAGWRGFWLAGTPGDGVKGQAALLEAELPADLPVIQGRGLYVCAHGRGRVAVGSTSEAAWHHEAPDGALDDVIARAAALCPRLEGAQVLRRWAGIRPRAPARVPMVGVLPGRPSVVMAGGGHKIGLALAHGIGRAVAEAIDDGHDPAALLPEDFAPARHLEDRRSAPGAPSPGGPLARS